MLSCAAEFDRLFLVSHDRTISGLASGFRARTVGPGAIEAGWHVDQAGIEFHSEAEAELLQLVLDLVERFLAEIAILEHLGFGLLRELTNGGDVGVVQAIGRANTELDF